MNQFKRRGNVGNAENLRICSDKLELSGVGAAKWVELVLVLCCADSGARARRTYIADALVFIVSRRRCAPFSSSVYCRMKCP